MSMDYQFDRMDFHSLVGGVTALDVSKLNIQNLDQARSFVRAYGFDPESEEDSHRIWKYHRRAVTFIQTELLEDGESFPESLSDPNQLKNICFLLIYASTHDQRKVSLQSWACAILKVIHVLVHLDNDLFTHYRDEIQDQILKKYHSQIYKDPVSGIYMKAGPAPDDRIFLQRFDTKPFKTSNSSVTKLLAKPDEIAFSLLDKMGVRFVTKHLYDVFRVIRCLIQQNIVSFPHVISDQSNNTVFPVNLFFEVMEGLTKEMELTSAELDKILIEKLEASKERAEYREKLNTFSSKDYQFLKFITRSLVHVPLQEGEGNFSFFYPYEVQIVHYDAYLQNLSGSASHEEYKKRQKRRARMRVLGFGPPGEISSGESDSS